MGKKIIVSIRIDSNLYKQVKKAAIDADDTVTAIVKRAFERYIRRSRITRGEGKEMCKDVFDFEKENLNEKQRNALKFLLKLIEFKKDAIAGNDITNWLRWDELDRSIDFIEGWGIDLIEAPSRKFTVDDLDNIYEFLLEADDE